MYNFTRVLTWAGKELGPDQVAQTGEFPFVHSDGVLAGYDVVELTDEGAQRGGRHHLQQVVADLGGGRQQQALQTRDK